VKLLICLMVGVLLLVAVGPASAQKAAELNQAGLAHFTRGFYEAAPRGEDAQAAEYYRLAEQAFQQAIQRQPDWVEPYLRLGRTYFVQKKYRQAAEVYRQALACDPQNKVIYTQLASALEMAGDYQGAIQTLQTLRSRETSERSIAKIDQVIKRMQARAQGGR
jgi:cytochrome c-type biogenesis protein CcmH/NrfG